MPEPLARYLEHLRVQKRLAPTTLRTYETDLATLLATLQSSDGANPLDALTERDVRMLAGRLRNHVHGKTELTARSIGRMLSVLRGYYDWRVKNHGLPDNPARRVKAPKADKRLPKALAVDATVALLEQKHDESALALRDAAMAELLYSSGLRISELIGLDVDASKGALGHVDLAEHEVFVTGKGDKRRSVPVGGKALEALAAWLLARGTLAKLHEVALFVGARGERIGGSSVRAALTQMARKSGTGIHVHPHMLRHSFASHVLQSSQDLRAVQEMMGHASIAATQVYTKLDFQHLASVYDAAHPRAKLQIKAKK